MSKYHINPKTGNAGACRATKSCPFGDLDADHYASAAEAREAFEAKRSAFGVKEIPHELDLDADTVELLDRITAAGAQPLVVGGTVRDSLATGVAPKDVDIEVHGVKSMEELVRLLKRHGYRLDEVGKSFGVLKTILPSGMDIDISLPRRDSLVGEGHRGFEVKVDADLTLEEAAARRDFTVNAMYYDHNKRAILDPHGGMKDWEDRKLRPVSEAFKEDPLRVLRGVQFASRFGLNVSGEFVAMAKEVKDGYGHLSEERVQEEFSKLFLKGKEPVAGLAVLKETTWGDHFGLDSDWFARHDLRKMKSQFKGLEKLSQDRDLPKDVMFAAFLMKTLPQDRRKSFAKKALIGDKPQNKAVRLASAPMLEGPHNTKTVKAWARALGKDGITVKEWSALHRTTYGNETVQNIESLAAQTNSFERGNPDLVTGQALMDLTGSKKGGRWIGEIMREAAQAQDDEVFKTQAEADDWLARRMENFEVPQGR